MTDPITIIAAVGGVAASPLVAIAVVKARMTALEDRTTEFKADTKVSLTDMKTTLAAFRADQKEDLAALERSVQAQMKSLTNQLSTLSETQSKAVEEVKRDKASIELVKSLGARITRLEEHLLSKLDEILIKISSTGGHNG